MKSLKDALAYRTSELKESLKSVKELKDSVPKEFNKIVDDIVACEPRTEVYAYHYSVYLCVPVKSMKHITEVLELLEARLGLDFDSTEDQPWSATRTFRSSKHSWLTLQAIAPIDEGEGVTCHRIQTGVKVVEQPIYALQCD